MSEAEASNVNDVFLDGYPGYPRGEDQDKEDFQMTRTELSQIENALKDKDFRKLLSDYVEEIRVSVFMPGTSMYIVV
jgi:hypothetical protein